MHLFFGHGADNHAHGAGVVRDGVYQDEGTRGLVLRVGVEEELLCSGHHHARNLVELHRQGLLCQLSIVNGEVLHRVDIHLILDAVHVRTAGVRGLLDEERLVHVHRLLVHPHQHGLEVAAHYGKIVRVHQHLAARHVDFILQRQRDGLGREGIIQLSVVGHDALDVRLLARWQGHHLVALAHHARSHLAAEAAEIKVGAQDVLHGEAEILQVMVVADVHRLQEIQQGRPRVPRRAGGLLHHIVPVQGRQRDARHVGHAQRLDELAVLRHNRIEPLFGEIHQVHLVHGQHHVLDAQQGNEERMAARLRDDAQAGIHQDDSQVGRRAARNHVARILLMSRRVGNDELALVGREVAVGHVNGDALLALGLQPVQQQRIVDMVAGIAHALAVALQRIELVFVYLLAVK